LLNGFLPCGMVYVALFAIAIRGLEVIYGSIRIGNRTHDVVIYINSYLTIPIRNKIQKVIPYVAVIIGLLFI
jgi:hypothetical protein